MVRILIPVALISGIFLILSLRLFRSARENQGAEGWLASFFFLVGISMPTRVLFAQVIHSENSGDAIAVIGTHFMMSLALCMFTVFIARVFRPDVRWARGLMMGIIALQVAAPVLLVFFGGHRNEQHASVLFVSVLRAIPFLWGFIEALRYYGQMRRRVALGLADPVVANRFLLFGGWTGSLFGLLMVTVIARVCAFWWTEGHSLMSDEPIARTLSSFLIAAMLTMGTTTAVSLWLGFFPPEAWVRRLRAGASPVSA